MVTAQQGAKSSVLLFARNGANRPLHQDRQVLRAGDLSLEQSTQDAMLARARRYLHGWGVVAGFLPDGKRSEKSGSLTIGPGYGVTPLGDELFVPEAVELRDAAAAVLRCCGPDAVGCDIIDPAALAKANEDAKEKPVSAWLIARPASREAAPRPGVPEDCAHPASMLLPSRRCGGVEFVIICTLPTSHQPRKLVCGELTPFVCGSDRGIEPLPWEKPFGPDANFVVIAALTVTGRTLVADITERRTLLPVALIQDWIAACVCPALKRTPSEPPIEVPHRGDPPVSPPPVVVTPLHVLEPSPPPPPELTPLVPPRETIPSPPHEVVAPPGEIIPSQPVREITPATPAPGLTIGAAEIPAPVRTGGTQDPPPALREQLKGAVTEISGIGDVRARGLAAIGVKTEGEFLTAPTAQLATALSLPEDKVVEMKKDVSKRHNLGLNLG